MPGAVKNIAYGLLATYALLLVAILIKPAGLGDNTGFSYYGGFMVTVVPFSLAFVVYAACLWRLAHDIKDYKLLSLTSRLIAILFVGLVLTPHTVVNGLHIVIGACLFSAQLLLSVWLLAKYYTDWLLWVLVAAELISGLVALHYLLNIHGFLLQSQAVYQLAFGCLLIRSLRRLVVKAS